MLAEHLLALMGDPHEHAEPLTAHEDTVMLTFLKEHRNKDQV